MNDIPETTETTETEAQPTQTQPSSLLDTAGKVETTETTEAPEWYEKVPEKFMGEDGPNVESLVDSYNNLETKLRNGVEVATDEEVIDVFKSFQFEYEDGGIDPGFREVVEKHSMSKDMIADLMPMYLDAYTAGQQSTGFDQDAMKQYMDDQEQMLRGDHSFGREYDKNIQIVQQFTRNLPEEVLELPLTKTAAGMMFLHSLATSGQPILGHSNAKTPPASIGDAKAELDRINRELGYMDENDPRYKELEKEAWTLAREIAPGLSVGD